MSALGAFFIFHANMTAETTSSHATSEKLFTNARDAGLF